MDVLHLYLLAGLIAHKVFWEVMKRRQGSPRPEEGSGAPSIRLRAVKAAKMAVLAGIVVQTMIPEVLPLTRDPWILRIAGVAIFTAGLLVAILGRTQLGTNWSDIETAQVQGDQGLVEKGLYGYIRHPIYVGDLALLLGLELALNSWLVLAIIGLAPLVLRQAIREEKLLSKKLPGYDQYCGRTKRFIPYLV